MTAQPWTPSEGNVNVTLSGESSQPRHTFPCPLCGAGLDLRQSRAQKPYCVCNSCGLQIFFRGKNGISRLRSLLNEGERLVAGPTATAAAAVTVFNRLEQLRAQKDELEERRGLIFVDDDLEHAIAAVAHEIARVQGVLDEMSRSTKG